MGILIVGLLIFIGIHLVPALPRKKHKFVKLLGDKGYKIAYGVLAVLGLVLIIWGYAQTLENPVVLFDLPYGMRHATMLLVLLAFILFASARLNGYLRYYARHPLTLAVKLWAFGHLLVKGGILAGLLLFGGFLAWAVFARISAKKREAAGLIKTRDFAPNWVHDVIAVVVGLGLYVAFAFYLHNVLIGVPLIR